MKNKVIIFLLFISFCCQSKRTLSHKVIRQNYFDSNYYKLNSLDTNNVNRLIYESIFDRVQFDTSVNCLLMKIYYDTYAQEEYGLYDYKSGKYFYTSAVSVRPSTSCITATHAIVLFM